MHLAELPVQVPAYDDLGACILLDDVLSQVNYGVCPFYHEALLPGFQILIQDVHLLPFKKHL